MIFLKSGKVLNKIFIWNWKGLNWKIHAYINMGGFVCTWSIENGQYAEPIITPIYNFNDFAFWFLNFIIIYLFILMITSHSQMRKKKYNRKSWVPQVWQFLISEISLSIQKEYKNVKWAGSCKQSTTYVNIYYISKFWIGKG